MKRLLILVLILTAFNMQAQDKKNDRKAMKKERLSMVHAEDIAKIKTKKMILALDLSEAQQKQVQQLNLKNTKLRLNAKKDRMNLAEKGEKPTYKERLKIKNDKLDQKIATKKEMKKILSETQYEKWNTITAKRQHKKKHKKKERRD